MASGSCDSEEIYGNNDTILLYQLGLTGKLLSALQQPGGYDGHDSREEGAECDDEEGIDDDDYDSFSSGEEEIEDTNYQEIAPLAEKITQVQDENEQGNPSVAPSPDDSCEDEDGYLVVGPSSPGGVNSQTPGRLRTWPLKPQPPSNISHQLSQGCGVQWKPHPTNKEMNSAVNRVFSHPQNNGRSPGAPSADHRSRGPPPAAAQKRDFQNKVFPGTPDSPSRPPPRLDKFDVSKLTLKGTTESEGSSVRPSGFGHQRPSLRKPQANCGPRNGPPSITNPQASNQQNTFPQQRQNSINKKPYVAVKSSPTSCGPPNQRNNNSLGLPQLAAPPPAAFVKLENGDKVTLTPLYRRIMDKPYFHLLSRDVAKGLIAKGGAGCFLFRPSRKTNNPLTITINNGSGIFHVSVRQRADKLFALGSVRREELAFSTIDELIGHHQQTPIVLSNGTLLTLQHSPVRTGNTYVQHTVPGLRGNRT